MGFVCAIAMMVAVFWAVWILSRWDARSAYRMLEHSQMFFEPEDCPTDTRKPPSKAGAITKPGRPYLSPFVKKQVAARQKWRCAICKQLLTETYEIDHILPLHTAKDEAARQRLNQPTNLQALCRRCHLSKSAMEAS